MFLEEEEDNKGEDECEDEDNSDNGHHDWQHLIRKLAHKNNKDHSCEANFDIL